MTEPFIGSIQYFAFPFAPKGWHLCDGSLLSITQYQAVFALFGTMYGGDGRTTFGLPDMRGRTITGVGQQYPVQGAKTGTESVTLLANNLPAHTHTVPSPVQIPVSTANAGGSNPQNAFPAVTAGGSRGAEYYASAPDANTYLCSTANPANVVIGQTGGTAPIDIRSPFIALTCAVALVGLFPSRN